MATLNEIAYNIKELMSGGSETLEQNISTRQIKHWIHYHRAKIIEEKLLSGAPLDRNWIQPIKAFRIYPADHYNYPSYYISQTAQNTLPLNNVSGMNEQYQAAWTNNTYYGKNYLDDNDNDYFLYTETIPNTINVGNRDGITDARIKRRTTSSLDVSAPGHFTGWSPVPIKTKDEAQYAWANRFTKIKTPYAIPYNYNSQTKLEVGGLRIRANRDSNTYIYEYGLEVYGILQNPTDSIAWEWETIVSNKQLIPKPIYPYLDSSDSYPMSNEDIPLLISRVAEVEMTLIMKTPEDLIEDNVDTTKINIGGQQAQ